LNADFGAHLHDIILIQKWVRGHSARLRAETVRNEIAFAIEEMFAESPFEGYPAYVPRDETDQEALHIYMEAEKPDEDGNIYRG
jgi:hypothetical protein